MDDGSFVRLAPFDESADENFAEMCLWRCVVGTSVIYIPCAF